jgi:tetratricopeptide (TPR) repeat protein
VTIAPNDWHVRLELASAAQEEKNEKEAEAELKHAIALNPNAGAAYNLLGYSYLNQSRFDDAIAAFKTYTEKAPADPNAFDSLGEAQLRSGKVADAEATFQKATELSKSFFGAFIGLAQTHFLRGDFAAGHAALDKAHQAAQLPSDKVEATTFHVWAHLAEGKAKEALADCDALEKEAKASREGYAYAMASVYKAAILTETGQHEKALGQIPSALDRAKKVNLQGDQLSALYRLGFLWKLRAELRLKKVKDADQSLAFLQKAVSMSLSAQSTSTRAFASGLVSAAKKEKKIGLQQMLECAEDDFLCRVELMKAYAADGDKGEADKVKEAILAANRRDAVYLYARSLVQKG